MADIDLSNGFRASGQTKANILPNSSEKLIKRSSDAIDYFQRPQDITLEIAKQIIELQMPSSRVPPSCSINGHVIMLTPDQKGFVIATFRNNDVSTFIKPADHRKGAFWEVNVLTGQSVRDPEISTYLSENLNLLGFVCECNTRLYLSEGYDSQLFIAAQRYIEDYNKMKSGNEQPTGPANTPR